MASTYLSRTPASAGNRKTWTFSAWVKRANLGSNGYLLHQGASNNTDTTYLYFTSDKLSFNDYDGVDQIWIRTNKLFRDVSAWYHIVLAVDTTQATSTDRIKIYVNGVQESSFDQTTYPSQNFDTEINSTDTLTIGRRADGSDYFNGSMAHVHLIDGTAYDADTFGETDATTGIWKPKTAPSVTYGTNGFFLKFENSGAFGTDSSGNANNFTVNGTMTQTIDTPSNVFATLNPLDKDLTGTLATYLYGNNRFSSSGNSTSNNGTRCTLGASSGKYYWEVKNVQNALLLGIQDADALTRFTSSWTWGLTGTYAVKHDGEKSINGTQTSSAVPTFTNGDILMLAMDLDNSKLYFGKNGTWSNSGDPTSGATGTGSIGDLISGTTYIPVVSNSSWSQNTIADFNFGNGFFGTTAVSSAENPDDGIGIFEHSVPNGYKALCTKSINSQEYD